MDEEEPEVDAAETAESDSSESSDSDSDGDEVALPVDESLKKSVKTALGTAAAMESDEDVSI